jgi:hypothetical protein
LRRLSGSEVDLEVISGAHDVEVGSAGTAAVRGGGQVAAAVSAARAVFEVDARGGVLRAVRIRRDFTV